MLLFRRMVRTIHYFSDGCASQYKNYRHSLNLCYHHEDFSMHCIWNFFAASHCRSPYDGLGGTVKRLAANASLQRPLDNQILTAKALYQFCERNTQSIKFMPLKKAELSEVRKKLSERFVLGKTIPGTRGFHQFTPLSQRSIGAARISEESHCTVSFNFVSLPKKEILDIKHAQFLICLYDEYFWLGMASEIDKENEDVLVMLMHLHFPTRSFTWPDRGYVCWAPHL